MRGAFQEWWETYGSSLWSQDAVEPWQIPPTRTERVAVALVSWAFALIAGVIVGAATVTALRGLGVPVPLPHHVAPRVAVYTGYGLGVLALGTWSLVIGRRALAPGLAPEQVSTGAGRLVGVLLLGVLTLGCAVVVYEGRRDPFAWMTTGGAAISLGAMTVRLARGREIDGRDRPGPRPATFDEPVRLLDDALPPPNVRHAEAVRRRPFLPPDGGSGPHQER